MTFKSILMTAGLNKNGSYYSEELLKEIASMLDNVYFEEGGLIFKHKLDLSNIKKEPEGGQTFHVGEY